MTTSVEKLAQQFTEKNRYANFGPCLRKIVVHGFRGLQELHVHVEHPITAISGINGAGKSTLVQLVSCAYRKPTTAVDYKRQYVKNFFPVSPADPTPILTDARITYSYETDDYRRHQEVTVSRVNSAWSGYKRQPERYCYYIGFTVYIPKVERRDLSVYGGASLKMNERRELDPFIVSQMARIIGLDYQEVSFQGVSHKDKKSEIGIASRLGSSYSENNMGFGEGRVLYTIDLLEKSPEQSLFVLEEPETSLHESAQREFARYLIDVCVRRHHQIFLTTHSSVMLAELPASSRKLIMRTQDGVLVEDRISATQLRSALSDGWVRDYIVFVEDEFAKCMLTEAIRVSDRQLLRQVAIHEAGDVDAVRKAAILLRKVGKLAIAVRDGDIGDSISEGIFSFPGCSAPEKVVFSHSDVKALLKQKYDLDVDWLMRKNNIEDHHQITAMLAHEADTVLEVVRTVSIECYVSANLTEFKNLIRQISNFFQRAQG
ncbi:MAG: ATP-binding protein [Burkholderiaceae bacterium]|nr:ATP-binding protein [Burkholderiaceae bacterium]MCD8517622.1 ATP-binding protein [Burkholderiaceae bacterium]MCD8537415.1 ATP-binding protein [Burkholderiaceae bacterium]MCD8565574.1 ATP-binding protein [Burkholderiaceae bacterium]